MNNNFPTAKELRELCNIKLIDDQKQREIKAEQNYEKVCKSLAEGLSHQAFLGKESFEFLWTKLDTPFNISFEEFYDIHKRIIELLEEKGYWCFVHEYSAQTQKKGKYGYLVVGW